MFKSFDHAANHCGGVCIVKGIRNLKKLTFAENNVLLLTYEVRN